MNDIMDTLFRELDLSLKKNIDDIKSTSGNNSAATSFLSMYMWRQVYGNRIFINDEIYSLKIKDEANSWFFPCGENEAKRAFINERLKDGKLRLMYACEEDVKLIKKYFANDFDIISTPDDFEYVYSVSEHKALAGKKFSRIRRELHNVGNSHEFEVVTICEENLHYLKEIEDKWLSRREKAGNLDTKGEELDLTIFDDVHGNGILGCILLTNKKPVAAVAGFMINDNMIDVFYGAKTDEINSSIDYALHEFVNRLSSDVKLFNLEEDLGIEGLRYWKEKLQPVEKIKMWECVQR